MGLMIHSLSEIPENVERDYYLYLLDYGWEEPLSNTIISNFGKIAREASQSNSIFITGTVGSHVDTEIMSWHHINGENADGLFPAILITKDNPHIFREMNHKPSLKSKIIIIPLKACCSSSTDVINLISKIFTDIKDKKELKDFKITKEMKKGIGRRLLDGVILEPKIAGMGFNLKAFFKR